uniref:ATP-dependent RNA helicase n=1 Tax=Anopheles farauti TaxID=69004 RepID=A0A182Q194_9DIPT
MQKQRKFNPKKRPQNAPAGRKGKIAQASWQPVILNGPVIADEGADFGGFIGLEVMENYTNDFVLKEKTPYDRDDYESFGKSKSKRKRLVASESDSDSDSNEDVSSKKKKKTKKKKEKKAKKAKTSAEDSGSEAEEDSDFDDQPKKGKPSKKEATVPEDDTEVESVPTTFSMLLKPPQKSQQKQQKQTDASKEAETTVSPINSDPKPQRKQTKQKDAVRERIKSDTVSDAAPKDGPKEEKSKPKQVSNGLQPKAATNKKQKQSKQNGKAAKEADTQAPESYSSVDYMEWIQLGVSEPIVRAIAEKGFKHPTEIQTKSLPVAIYGRRDLLGAAETGSGKTLAFGIPMLEGIMRMKKASGDRSAPDDDASEHELTPPPEDVEMEEEMEVGDDPRVHRNHIKTDKPLYGLILTPTRELAVQINDHLKAVAKYTDINIATVFGGLATVKQERLLRKCPEIVIATPGRLWELIQSENHHLSKVTDIRFLVIDETDRMLEKGHFEELKQLLEMINANEEGKNRRRNYIFSATLTMDHELPEHLKKNPKKSKQVIKQTPGQRMQNLIEIIGMTNPKVVDLTQDHGTARTLTESRILCQMEHKDFYLYYFLERHPGRTLVFCNSIDCVKRLVSLFGYLNCAPLSLFGSMQQRQRLKNLERFTANPRALLIATDVAARGLDIPNVDHVLHYQVPKTTENYVHRSGRTARASKEGLTVLLIGPAEVKDYVKLNHDLGRTEDLPLYPTSERVMRQVKERVQLARQIERLDLQQRRQGADRSWEDKLAKEFESESDVDSEQEEYRRLEETKRKRQFLAKRTELSQMLAKPIMLGQLEMNYPSLNVALANPGVSGEKNQSAISLVRKAEEERALERKQRRNKKRRN